MVHDVGDLGPGAGHFHPRGAANGAIGGPLHRVPLGEVRQRGGLRCARGLAARGRRLRLRGAAFSPREPAHVLCEDPAAWTRGFDVVQGHAELPGQPPGRGRSRNGAPRPRTGTLGGGLLARVLPPPWGLLLVRPFRLRLALRPVPRLLRPGPGLRLGGLAGGALPLLFLLAGEGHQEVAHLHLVARLDVDALDGAAVGRGQLGGRLVGLHREDRIALFHRIPFGAVDLHHLLLGHLLPEGAVDALGLEEDHRVGVPHGAGQKGARIARGGGDDHLEARSVGEEHLLALGVVLQRPHAAAVGHAHHHGDLGTAPGSASAAGPRGTPAGPWPGS
jgi:hypothetical protein